MKPAPHKKETDKKRERKRERERESSTDRNHSSSSLQIISFVIAALGIAFGVWAVNYQITVMQKELTPYAKQAQSLQPSIGELSQTVSLVCVCVLFSFCVSSGACASAQII